VKLARARKFLVEGHKVKISLRFRGREITHPDLGRVILERAQAALADIGEAEQPPQLTGRDLNIILGQRKDAKTKES
jgi:translation initiation factor IF-3